MYFIYYDFEKKKYECKAFLVAQMVKNLPMMQET